jgi:hypothetical protein
MQMVPYRSMAEKWIETEKNLFVREDGVSKLGFREDASGKITHMSYWWVLDI